MSNRPLVNYPLIYPPESTSLDKQALQDLIQSQGIDLVHYKAMPTPMGLRESQGEYRPIENKGLSTNGLYIESNGFLYRKAGSFKSIFTSVTKDIKANFDLGHLDQSTSQIIIPTKYDEDDCGRTDTDVYVSAFDRVYLKDDAVLVVYWQLYDYNITGRDRLHFLVEKVMDVVDNQGKSYVEGSDFIVQDGQIVWTGSNRPGIDSTTNKGRVVSIRYLYRPYYYVQHLLHEIRVAQTIDELTGERKVNRLPQLAILQREYVFLNKEPKDNPTPTNSRNIPGPGSSTGFGPR